MDGEIVSMPSEVRAVDGTNARTSLWKVFCRQWDLQLMVIPATLFLLVFCYVPMWGLLFAFQDYDIFKGFFHSSWVGFKHFIRFFPSPDFPLILKNTLVISSMKLFILFPLPLLLALLLNEVRNTCFKRIVQTVSYLPHFVSWIVIAGLASAFLAVDHGTLNQLLKGLGLIREPVNWLSSTGYFRWVLVAVNVWKEVGFGSVVYLAAISGIEAGQFEIAELEGADRLQKVGHVILPNLAPVVGIFLILAAGNLMNAGYEDILALTNNGANAILYDVSEVIDTYIFKRGISTQQYSFATSVGLFKAAANIILLGSANFLTRRLGRESLW